MPPKKKARTMAPKEKPAQVMPVVETASSTSSSAACSHFFQPQARAERSLGREHFREAQEASGQQQREKEREEETEEASSASASSASISAAMKPHKEQPTEVAMSSTAMKRAPIEIEQAQEKIATIKANLQKSKSELEQQMLTFVSERSSKRNAELAKLDFTIRDLIGQLKLVYNQLDSWEKRTGMIFEHQQIIRDIVTANGLVSWYRPINLEAESWLLKGAQGKALLTKGKSSGFDYIAGLIPVDVRLSKLMRDSTRYNPRDIAYYQSNMDFVMDMYDTQKVSNVQIERAYHDRGIVTKIELARTAVSALELKANQQIAFEQLTQYRKYIEAANELPKQIAADHTYHLEGQAYSVYYLVNQKTQTQDRDREKEAPHRADVVFQDNQPVFLIEKDKQYFVYNTRTHMFDIPHGKEGNLPGGCDKQTLQVMAYQQFELDEDRHIRLKKPRLVTADYDEGSSVALRVHPFMQRTELRTDSFSLLGLTQPQTPGVNLQQAIDQFTVETLQRHETDRNREAQDVATHGTMGRANDTQRAMIAYLRDETGWTVNHGPEANSPAPQRFEEREIYPCFYPDGRVELLEGSEETICELINRQRALGFPLAVNPKWDWQKDPKTGRFSIPNPRDRFDWEPVDRFLHEGQLQAEAIEQEYKQRGEATYETFLIFELEELGLRAQKEESLNKLDRDRLLFVSYHLAAEIVAIMLQIESLRVEPDLVYPGLLESYRYRVLSQEDKELYQQRIQGLIEQFHRTIKVTDIGKESSIPQVRSYYDSMEKQLLELEQKTAEYQIRQRYDELIKQRLAEGRNQTMQQLFQKLQEKRERFRSVSFDPTIFFSLIERKTEDLFELFRFTVSSEVNLRM